MDVNGMKDFIDEINIEEVQLDQADEAAIFLTALESVLTPEEFNLVLENATELELYGLIPDAAALEAAKKIVYKQTKSMNVSREEAKACIRMAKKANTAAYKKYAKGRAMMLEGREEMFRQHKGKAHREAIAIVRGANKKASAMRGTVSGETIEKGLKKKMKELDTGTAS